MQRRDAGRVLSGGRHDGRCGWPPSAFPGGKEHRRGEAALVRRMKCAADGSQCPEFSLVADDNEPDLENLLLAPYFVDAVTR